MSFFIVFSRKFSTLIRVERFFSSKMKNEQRIRQWDLFPNLMITSHTWTLLKLCTLDPITTTLKKWTKPILAHFIKVIQINKSSEDNKSHKCLLFRHIDTSRLIFDAFQETHRHYLQQIQLNYLPFIMPRLKSKSFFSEQPKHGICVQ